MIAEILSFKELPSDFDGPLPNVTAALPLPSVVVVAIVVVTVLVLVLSAWLGLGNRAVATSILDCVSKISNISKS